MTAVIHQVVDSEPTTNAAHARAAAINVMTRNRFAMYSTPAFSNPDHVNRVDTVKAIADKFFTVRETIYVNHRPNNKKPFTVVKVSRPQWPRVNNKTSDEKFYTPLKDMNVEIRFAPKTNSYLLRVYC